MFQISKFGNKDEANHLIYKYKTTGITLKDFSNFKMCKIYLKV